jgi:hypothetical protein
MKLYFRIKEGVIVEENYFDTPPVLSENKGQWIEVIDSGQPAFNPDLQICERLGGIIENYYVINYTVRDKTLLELWQYPEWAIRLICDKSLLFQYPTFILYFQDEGFPIEKSGNERIIYCNTIAPDHEAIFKQLMSAQLLKKEERPIL